MLLFDWCAVIFKLLYCVLPIIKPLYSLGLILSISKVIVFDTDIEYVGILEYTEKRYLFSNGSTRVNNAGNQYRLEPTLYFDIICPAVSDWSRTQSPKSIYTYYPTASVYVDNLN